MINTKNRVRLHFLFVTTMAISSFQLIGMENNKLSLISTMQSIGTYVVSYFKGKDTLLMEATVSQDTQKAETLLINGANLYIRNKDGDTIFHIAAKNDDHAMLDVFCNYAETHKSEPFIKNLKDNVNLKNSEGRSPLHLIGDIRRQCDGTCIKKLLFLEANINLQDDKGCTPLLASLESGSSNVANFFLKQGANPLIADYDSNTIFHKIVFYDPMFIGKPSIELSKIALQKIEETEKSISQEENNRAWTFLMGRKRKETILSQLPRPIALIILGHAGISNPFFKILSTKNEFLAHKNKHGSTAAKHAQWASHYHVSFHNAPIFKELAEVLDPNAYPKN